MKAVRIAKEKTVVENMTDRLIDITNRVKEIEEENEEVFTERQELLDEAEGLKERIKVEVRKKSKEGQQIIIRDDSSIHISVQGRRKPVLYDFDKATEKWPSSLVTLAQVRALDVKIVDTLIFGGKLTKEQIKAVQYEGELPTPAVTIRIV